MAWLCLLHSTPGVTVHHRPCDCCCSGREFQQPAVTVSAGRGRCSAAPVLRRWNHGPAWWHGGGRSQARRHRHRRRRHADPGHRRHRYGRHRPHARGRHGKPAGLLRRLESRAKVVASRYIHTRPKGPSVSARPKNLINWQSRYCHEAVCPWV